MCIVTPTMLGIAALVGAAGTAASTGMALAKGGPKMPKAPAPAPAPPTPPPVAPLPPAPTETQVDESVAKDRRKSARRFGVANTLLASPLGASGAQDTGQTLLGG